MKCLNSACGKNIATPLELFNGLLACPHCKKELTIIRDFKITEHNNDLFNLSELYYYKYLTSFTGEQPKSKNTVAKKILLEKAIATCKEAAYLGHPEAVFKMGGYYESYFETMSDSDRKRVAFEYYAALCYSNKSSVEKEESISGFNSEQFAELKRLAAIKLYSLVCSGDKEFGSLKKYDRELNRQRIISEYGVVEYNALTSFEEDGGKAEMLKKLFHGCISKKGKAPLFGIYGLKGSELKEIFSSTAQDKNKSIYRILTRGLEIRFIESENGRVDEIDGYFVKMTNQTSAMENLSDINQNGEYYLYFFNEGGKHQFLSSVQMKKVKRALEQNQFEQIKRLINAGAEDYTFFDDDIVMFKKGNNLGAAIEGLMDYICEEN